MIIIEFFQFKIYIYRDLKPSNFILNKNKTVVLIDFDRMISHSNPNSTRSFGHNFCAPKVVSDEMFNEKADIYSLGLIIYFIIFEKYPLIEYDNSSNPIKYPFHEFQEEYPILKKICEDCTRLKPDERPCISYLIDTFYFEFFSKIPVQVLENDLIRSVKDIHTEKFAPYWIFLAEKNNPFCLFKLGSFYNFGLFLTGIVTKKDITEERYIPDNINKKMYYFTLASNEKIPEACYNLGLMYFEGIEIPRDINKAMHYLTLSANQNFSPAQCQLGFIFWNGKLIQQDIKKALYYLTLSANQNDSDAQLNLGQIYDNCFRYKNSLYGDIEKAIHYYSLAAKNNSKRAQYCLGNIFYIPEYKRLDFNKAIDYFTLAANQNVKEAQNNLGLIYSSYEYKFHDIDKAIYYFTCAANQNHPHSQFNLGRIYEIGILVPRNIPKAIHYYELAAHQNFSRAQFRLGVLYYNGEYVQQNISKAINYLLQASEQNDPLGLTYLGLIYFSGIYVKQDLNKAIYYYTKAANLGHPNAQYSIGIIYYLNGKCFQDIKKGIYYLALSAKNGYIESYFYLGCFYFQNNYIPRDIEISISYYREASSFNDRFAKNNFAIIMKNGYNDRNPNLGYAVILLKEAIKLGDVVAMFNLANIYWQNEKSKKAIKLLIKSSLKDFKFSLIFLSILLVKRIDNLTIKTIQDEIKQFGIEISNLDVKLFCIINKLQLKKWD
ncbi:hypothetical protein M9Y10_029468 [Tritrichomonas musculus]|uniref:Protein kinase domain-containing protein n=1 Tax=Tritrichomonas musculus TaxID=1915356 RepID=A0ABR2KM82_9EUKA